MAQQQSQSGNVRCPDCGQQMRNQQELDQHKKNSHQQNR